LLAAVPAEIQAALDRAIITIECEGDFENIVTGAIIEAFRKGGFKAASGKARGTNRAVVKIAGNSEKPEAGTFYAPRLTLTVYGEGRGAFFVERSRRPQRHVGRECGQTRQMESVG